MPQIFAAPPRKAASPPPRRRGILYPRRRAFARLLRETPDLAAIFAAALANLAWQDTHRQSNSEEPPPEVIERLTNLYLGQIEANYGTTLTVAAE